MQHFETAQFSLPREQRKANQFGSKSCLRVVVVGSSWVVVGRGAGLPSGLHDQSLVKNSPQDFMHSAQKGFFEKH